MSIELATILILAGLVGLLALGVPIGFASGLVAVGTVWFAFGAHALPLLASRAFSLVVEYVLIAVPMFVLMAAVLDRAGIARDLFRAMHIFSGRMPGGLALQTLLAAVVMAAMTGIIGSEIVLLGLVALPQMLSAGYDRKLAIGTICSGGALGTMIPPSIVLIIYGLTVNVSIADVFLASFIPGLMLAGLYGLYIFTRSVLSPQLAPPASAAERDVSRDEKLRLLAGLTLPLLVIASVMVTIYAGIASVSEASAVGALGAISCAAVRGKLSAGLMRDCLAQTVDTCGKVVWLVIGATTVVGAYNLLGGAQFVKNAILSLDVEPLVVIIVMQLIIIVLGCFMDWIGTCLLTMPVFVPIVGELGYDPIWFGVLFSMNVQIGFLSPPFGGAAFYLKSVAPAEISLQEIFSALWPFMGLQLLGLALVLLFPDIALWLPNQF